MTSKVNGFILFIFVVASIAISASRTFAATPQRIIVIDTDDSPGNTYIDVVQGENHSLQSLVYEAVPTLTFSLQELETQPAVLDQQSGKNIILLQLEQPFDPILGGHVIVQYLNNGITNSYKDFRILITVQGTNVTFSSDPDPNDPLSDGNSFTSVFNKLFMWKRMFLGEEIGIDHVSPSVVPPDDVTSGPAPALDFALKY